MRKIPRSSAEFYFLVPPPCAAQRGGAGDSTESAFADSAWQHLPVHMHVKWFCGGLRMATVFEEPVTRNRNLDVTRRNLCHTFHWSIKQSLWLLYHGNFHRNEQNFGGMSLNVCYLVKKNIKLLLKDTYEGCSIESKNNQTHSVWVNLRVIICFFVFSVHFHDRVVRNQLLRIPPRPAPRSPRGDDWHSLNFQKDLGGLRQVHSSIFKWRDRIVMLFSPDRYWFSVPNKRSYKAPTRLLWKVLVLKKQTNCV